MDRVSFLNTRFSEKLRPVLSIAFISLKRAVNFSDLAGSTDLDTVVGTGIGVLEVAENAAIEENDRNSNVANEQRKSFFMVKFLFKCRN